MGEAKRRGTYEERKTQSLIRQKEEKAQEENELSRIAETSKRATEEFIQMLKLEGVINETQCPNYNRSQETSQPRSLSSSARLSDK